MNGKVKSQRKLFRIPAAVDYLGGAVKAAMFRQMIWRRQIEVVRIGRIVCIPQDVLDDLIERGTTPARRAE